MKAVRSFLKFAAVVLTAIAVFCCIVAYWDKICETFARAVEKIREKASQCPVCHSEYDDYADWE